MALELGKVLAIVGGGIRGIIRSVVRVAMENKRVTTDLVPNEGRRLTQHGRIAITALIPLEAEA